MAKRYRWVCPECGGGKLASSRPALNATARYCLACSERTGFLVERSAPALEAKRKAKAARASAKRATKKRQAEAKYLRCDGSIDLRKEVARCCKAARVGVPRGTVYRYRSYGTSGHAGGWGGVLCLSVSKGANRGAVLALVAHEVAHLVTYDGHGSDWRAAFLRIVRKAYKVDAGDPGGGSQDLHAHITNAINEGE